jgi:hypothetical protein
MSISAISIVSGFYDSGRLWFFNVSPGNTDMQPLHQNLYLLVIQN